MKVKVIGHLPEKDLVVGEKNPWLNFFNEFKEMKYEVVSGDLINSKIDLLIVNSHSPKTLKKAKKLGINKKNIIMIYWEPFVSYPKIHSARIRSKYGSVYTPSKLWSLKLDGEYFFWPQAPILKRNQKFVDWKKRKNKSTMILSNKFSAAKGQNYTLRRNTDLLKDLRGNYLVDLFGQQWNLGFIYDLRHFVGQLLQTPINKIDLHSWKQIGKKQKNYLGPTFNKHITGSEYRIVLVIENCNEYISEKLFEAHLSQAIVVYIGADLKSEGINPEIAIQCEPKIESIQKLIEHLINLKSEEQYDIMKKQHLIAHQESLVRNHNLVLSNLGKAIVAGAV